jgi:diacylglycerol kinase (ATP)
MRIIANPKAGHGRGRRAVARLRSVLDARRIDYHLLLTEGPGHAVELARAAVASQPSRLTVVGGDGTLSEVINGVLGTGVEIAIIPAGTGNDVARTMKLPYNDLLDSVDIALSGRSRAIDIGAERERCFVSGFGVGFPSLVAEQSRRVKWLGGSAAFAIAVFTALHRMRPIRIRLILDGEGEDLTCTSVLVQNTPYTGGGLLIAPDAVVDDGWLDVVVIGPIRKLDLLVNFARVYEGSHRHHPAFSVYRARRVQIETDELLPKMFDGDVFGSAPVDIEVRCGAVHIVAEPGHIQPGSSDRD